MDESERKQLIADLRNQTEIGRLNHDVVESVFAKMGELGYEVVKKDEPIIEPEPAIVPEPSLSE